MFVWFVSTLRIESDLKIYLYRYLVIFLIFFPSFSYGGNCPILCGVAPGFKQIDPHTLLSPANLIKDFPSINKNGSVNVVIEIPAGRTDKWETRKSDGALTWNIKKGKPRVVKYIGYPGNYGMIPQTMLPKELGGDGDALDAIVLGPTLERGSVIKARLIGVLKLLDNGEQDDKLIAVNPDSPFTNIMSIKELDKKFNGITDILETWFINYKGLGEIQSKGFGDTKDAKFILHKANSYFLNRNKN